MIDKTLDASLLFSILDLTSQIRLRGDLIYKYMGLTTQQYVVMLHLANDPNIPFIENGDFNQGMFASEVAKSLKISRPSITNLLKLLIQKKLVKQTEDSNDRRRKRLKLTKNGEQMILEMEKVRKVANSGFLAQFDESEKLQFLNFIKRCSSYAKDQLENPEELTKMHERILALRKES